MKSDSQLAPTIRPAGARCMQWLVWALLPCLLLAPRALSAKEYLVTLEPAVSPQGFSYAGILDTARQTPFPKEPAGAGKVVRRGTLQLVGVGTPTLSYLWTRDGTLRLDLNRNEDLTDDPSGVYKTIQHTESWGYVHATFTNVLWKIETNAVLSPLTMDLNLWEMNGRRGASGSLRSYLSGRLEIDDKAWEVGVVPSFRSARDSAAGRSLMLRPWEARKESFSAEGNRSDVVQETGRLFFDGHAFTTSFSAGTAGAAAASTLKFTEQPVELGELKIAGSHVGCLVLEGTGGVAVVNLPGQSTRVPVGRYNSYRVRLGSGTNAAFREMNVPARAVVVESGKAVTLAVGGPLTNQVDVTHYGQNLRLSYRLVGVGRESYEFKDDSRDNPPRYAIYEGGRKVASGKFEYG